MNKTKSAFLLMLLSMFFVSCENEEQKDDTIIVRTSWIRATDSTADDFVYVIDAFKGSLVCHSKKDLIQSEMYKGDWIYENNQHSFNGHVDSVVVPVFCLPRSNLEKNGNMQAPI